MCAKPLSPMSPIISVAPMMDYTDRHDRFFLRLISPDIHLYTEMITTKALIHGDANYLLKFNAAEKYLALQLGGSDPRELAHCAKLGEDAGYSEINLNVGCPSSRVKAGRFGACLMLEPHLVAECVHAMQAQVKIPVTVKCRIGVDEQDSDENLSHFITSIVHCSIFIIHARKAWLKGLSPKQNREIPPLQYDRVYQVKKDFPHLKIIINGGIKTIADIKQHLKMVDGVMIGREAYSNPYFLAALQTEFYANKNVLSRDQIIEKLLVYIDNEIQTQTKLSSITRHILGLYQGLRGASAWRRYLSQYAHPSTAGREIVEKALQEMRRL